MTISMTCDSCGAQLRFGDQHAGKKIRCPKCQEILSAPATPDVVAPAPAATRPASRTRNTPQTSSNPQRAAEPVHRYNDEFEDYPPRETARRTSRRPMDDRRNTNRSKGMSSGLWIGLGVSGFFVACGGCALAIWLFVDFGGSNDVGQSPAIAATESAGGSAPGGSSPHINMPGVNRPDESSGNAASAPQNRTSPNGSSPNNGTLLASTPNNDRSSNSAGSGAGNVPTTLGGVIPKASQPEVPVPGFVTPGVGVPNSPAAPVVVNPAATANSGTPATPTTPNPSTPTPATPNPTSPAPTAPGPAAPANTSPGMLVAADSELPLSDLFARVKPAVVRVNVATVNGSGQGSGFVVDPSGVIVTNYHVVAGGNRAWVEFFDNERVEIEGVLYLNYKKDLALLKIDPAKTKRQLVGIPLAKDLPAQGVTVAAIGAPLGLDMSISEGIVSAVRTANELRSSIGLSGHEGTWVQTTAAISPGNSGGPLLNRRGEVIAINTMTYAAPGAQALNFGISCADIGIGVAEKDGTAVALTPLIAPERDIGNNIDPSTEGDLIDVSATDEGKRLLAEVKKVQITMLASSASDPNGVVIGAVRSELNNTLKRLKIEESILSNDVNILLIAVRLDPAGDKRSVFITAHIISEDKSTGVPRALKLWEKTGNAGSVPIQALLTGRLSSNFTNDLRVFFGKMREDVMNARKALKPDSEE